MHPKNSCSEKNIFFAFCETVARLRSENGCPWDRQQDVVSLKKYIREECDELLEAIDGNDSSHICEEVGDLFFLLVLLSQINSESGQFTIEDVLEQINEKMIRRHPHVFAGTPMGNEDELRKQWKKIKSRELQKKTN